MITEMMTKESKNTYQVPLNREDITNTSSDPETYTGEDENAIDYTATLGNDIRAAAHGVVTFAKDDSQEGGDDEKYEDFKFYNHLVIKHYNGEYTEYGHLKYTSITKLIGDKVEAGEIVAQVGNTGYSEGPHLHFSVFVLDKMDTDFTTLPKGKKYFINDKDLGFHTIKPQL